MSPKIPPPPPSGKDKTITFHRFPHHIWHDQNLSLHERVVLCRVWSFENSTPPLPCYLSFEQWAKELGCKRRHTIKLLNSLIEKKLLSKTGRGTQTNLWALVHTEHQQEDASVHRTLPSAYRTLALVHTEHQTSVLSAPKKIKEDHKEDHKEDQAVADAPPLPIESLETLSQESDSLRELTEVSEAPPLPAPPPKAKKAKQPESGWAEVQAAATPEQWESIEMWRKHRTQMKKPCTPLSIMQNIKKYGSDLSAAIEHSIEKGWQGIYFSGHTQSPGASGLTYQQQQTWFRDVWNEAHDLDRPDLSWVTKEQGAFLRKLMGRLGGSETDYVEILKKKRPDQFEFQFNYFANAIKELEQELSR